jgi:two-component system, chemotaxis family, chemotaxis protein CheY
MSKKSVLIVDDSLTVRQQVSLTLTSAGYQIVEASDGREGVDALRTHAEIAMVLCDLNMPNMNGLEFLDSIRGDAAGLPVPVVMLTTDGSPELIARAKRAGAKGWIVKPFQTELLLAAVRRIAGEPG